MGLILGSIFNKRNDVIYEHPLPNIVDDKISLLVKCNLQAKSKFPRLCRRFLVGRYQTLLSNFKMVPQPSSWVEIELHIVVHYHPPQPSHLGVLTFSLTWSSEQRGVPGSIWGVRETSPPCIPHTIAIPSLTIYMAILHNIYWSLILISAYFTNIWQY